MKTQLKPLILFIFLISGRAFAQWVPAGPPGGAVHVASNSTHLFAGIGTIYQSADGGVTWETGTWTPAIPNNRSLVFLMATESVVFASFAFSGLYYSTNNGQSWTKPTGVPPNETVLSATIHNGTLFLSTFGDRVLKSTNATFTNFIFPANNGLPPTNPTIWEYSSIVSASGKLFVTAVGNGVYVSTNEGANWTPVAGGLNSTFITDMATDGSTLYAGSVSDGLFQSTNGGDTWTGPGAGFPGGRMLSFYQYGNTLIAATLFGSAYHVPGSPNWVTIADAFGGTSYTVQAGKMYFADTGNVWKRPVSEVVTSAKNQILMDPFQIKPNPTNDYVQFILPASTNDQSTVTIFDARGKQIYQFVYNKEITKEGIGFSTERLPSGIYTVSLQTGHRNLKEKLMVVH
jgi:hypothetical protein